MEKNHSRKQSAFLLLEKFAAAVAAAFLPVAVYYLAHVEAQSNPYLWAIVVAGLAYSAPSVAQWANGWTRSMAKSIGFTVLLEGVLVFSETPALSLSALSILASINCLVAVAAMRNRARAFTLPTKRKASKRKATPALA